MFFIAFCREDDYFYVLVQPVLFFLYIFAFFFLNSHLPLGVHFFYVFKKIFFVPRFFPYSKVYVFENVSSFFMSILRSLTMSTS